MDSNIVVLRFDGKNQAENMLSIFNDMQDRGIVTLEDSVIASRGPGDNVEIKQTQSVTGKYTLRGTGIGLLGGLLLGGPIGGLVAGAAIGAISGHMKDLGIDDNFIRDSAQALGPNSSALFVMGRAKDLNGFYQELKPYKAVVATTTLSPEQEKRLKAALAHED